METKKFAQVDQAGNVIGFVVASKEKWNPGDVNPGLVDVTDHPFEGDMTGGVLNNGVLTFPAVVQQSIRTTDDRLNDIDILLNDISADVKKILKP